MSLRARIATSRTEVLAILLDRREEIDVSLATIDDIAGLADRYASKILTLKPRRQLSPVALSAVLGALALGIGEIIIFEDAEQALRMRSRWSKRGPSGPRPISRCVVLS